MNFFEILNVLLIIIIPIDPPGFRNATKLQALNV